ncbi:CLUMA_CG003945, isoform A [Clunio marinus]|uniref:CLUMA_CG003945, isoform A n=1 Tax=Clunio marinus TaxID=568069 RepID=A0A1J1HQ94_9DIPT|nr:CLUMA_CG003945, isoform A [Clunio marinus]
METKRFTRVLHSFTMKMEKRRTTTADKENKKRMRNFLATQFSGKNYDEEIFTMKCQSVGTQWKLFVLENISPSSFIISYNFLPKVST